MADETLVSTAPLERTIDGKVIKFARLSLYDRAELLRQWRKEQRDALKARLDECGAPPDQKFVQLNNFDSKPAGWFAWADFFNDYEGMTRILAKSAAKADPANELAGKHYVGEDAAILAAAVSHTPVGDTGKSDPKTNRGDTGGPESEETVDKKPKAFGEF